MVDRFAGHFTAGLPRPNNKHRVKIFRKFMGYGTPNIWGKDILDIGKSNYVGRELGITDFTSGDLNKTLIAPKEKYDIITCFEVLSHTYNHGILLDNIKARLKDGGTLYLSTPLVWGIISLPHGRGNYAEMTKDSVWSLLEMKGFEVVRYQVCRPWPFRFIFFGFLAPIRALMGKPKEEEGIAAVSTPMFSWWFGFKPVFKYCFNRFQLYECILEEK